MPQPTVTVIIPTFLSTAADRAHLDDQLESLVKQDYQGDFEVVVADNGSRIAVRTQVADSPHREQLSLRYVDASGRPGAAHARNVGAASAGGHYLLFCDHDDRVEPEWISRLVEFLDEGYDLASSAVEGRTLNSAHPRRLAEIPAPEHFQPLHATVPTLVGSSMAGRAQVYRELGGMNADYPANEDVEFGWRAAAAGFRVGFLPLALVAYRYRPSFRAGLRQGRSRGLGLARLNAEFPENGLPPIRFPLLLLTFVAVSANPKAVREERGLLLGITLGQLIGGIRYRSLRWW